MTMTDIEAKALALVNEVFMERCLNPDTYTNRVKNSYHEAICRAIERFEATESRHAAELRAAEDEIEERDEWAQIVDTTPLDGFDALADSWISRPVITRMLNAISSVFTKYATEQIMVRFRESMSDIMHQSFVEGCIVGVKNERARAALKGPSHDAN